MESCRRLFEGHFVGINLVGDDGLVYLPSYHGPHRDEIEKRFPVPLSPQTGAGVAILERRVAGFPDTRDPAVPELLRQVSQTAGVLSVIFAPMLWEGRGVGAVFVGRQFAGEFSEKATRLLKT